jgi:hypothetical protein
MGLELSEMTKLFTWGRLSSNLTHANSVVRKLQFTVPVTCCSHIFQQPLTWIYVNENNLENSCLLLGTCQDRAETYVDMLQGVKGWVSKSILYLTQMKQAKHYLDCVHLTYVTEWGTFLMCVIPVVSTQFATVQQPLYTQYLMYCSNYYSKVLGIGWLFYCYISDALIKILFIKVKVKHSLFRPGQALRFHGGRGT